MLLPHRLASHVYDYAWGLHTDRFCGLGLRLCVQGLELNFIFEFVFGKWSLMGQGACVLGAWSLSSFLVPPAPCFSGIDSQPSTPSPFCPHLASSFIYVSLFHHCCCPLPSMVIRCVNRGGLFPPLPSSPMGCICRWGEGQGAVCAPLCLAAGPRRSHPWPGWQHHSVFAGRFSGGLLYPAGMEGATFWGLSSTIN